jgi:Dolichyl-phosphate-mannose-protein mannosyltransferase
MKKYLEKTGPVKSLLIFTGLIAVYRLFVIGALPISPDEAYYWTWSKRLAVCYYDQPGMVAWVDWLFALPFKRESVFTLRLAAVSLSALTTLILYKAYREYRENKWEALVFAGVYSILPFSWAAGVMTIHDSTLLPWLALTYWMIIRISKYNGKALDWFLLGICLTGAMYAKFSAVMVVWGLFLYMVVSPRGRSWWKTWPPYAAGLISATLYLPVIWWNYQNNWISIQAVTELTDIAEISFSKRFQYFYEYVFSQIGIFSPFLGVIVFAALIKSVAGFFKGNKDNEIVLMACLALPVFLYFLKQSFGSHVYGNWPGVVYIPVSMLAMREVSLNFKNTKGVFGKKFVRIAFLTNIVVLIVFSMHFHFRLFSPFLEKIEEHHQLERKIDWRLDLDFAGWEKMVELVEKNRQGTDFIITRRYQTASLLEWSLPDRPFVECLNIGERGNQWDIWSNLDKLKGKDALYVDYKRMESEVLQNFDHVEPVYTPYFVGDVDKPKKRWFIYICKGWRGSKR